MGQEFWRLYIRRLFRSPTNAITYKRYNSFNTSKPFYIESLWVNYQKKYEFNPPHNHSGIYSFVIIVDIPFDLEKEYEYFGEVGGYRHNVPKRNSIYTSNFAFINTDYSGDIRCDSLNVDKSYEGKIIMFPAKQLHQVFPFYTSDGYRITVSGNLRLLVWNQLL